MIAEARRRATLAPSALGRLEAALGRARGQRGRRSSGPRTPPTATTRRTSRCRRARELGRPPRELAAELAARAVECCPRSSGREVAGPGFLNLRVTDAFLGEVLAEIDPGYGGGSAAAAERIQVEMVSANPTGPITVASGRNGALGDSVARLLEFAGHEVEREYYYNDAGAQMDRFRASVEAVRARRGAARGRLPRRLHRRARAPSRATPCRGCSSEIEATLERFRIHFDSWARQSELERDLESTLAALADLRARRGALRRARPTSATTRTAC